MAGIGSSAGGHPRAASVRLVDLAVTFGRIASSAFGGGSLALTRRELVNHRRWLDEAQFLEMLSLAQVAPGPNLTNLAVLAGLRLRGDLGALVAFVAMLVPGWLMLMLIAAVIARGTGLLWLDAGLRGCAAGAVGLTLGNAIEMSLRYRRDPTALVFVLAGAVAIVVFHASLLVVLAVLVPVSYAVLGMRRT